MLKSVKFIGPSITADVWKNQSTKRSFRVIKNREFKVGNWSGEESVLTSKNEWICDTDSKFFEQNFVETQS